MKSPRPSIRPELRDLGPPPATRPARASAPSLSRFSSQVVEALARRTHYVDPGLVTRWSEIAGPELSRLCRPGRLTGGQGGRTLEVVVPHGAAAVSVEFAAETLRRRLNAYFGPQAIARIAIVQGAGGPGRNAGAPAQPGAGLSRFRRG
ncbi:MAG: DUF721 domain-containing protein [Parvularculaceae bacterium]|nr:DUF721 domain-containing protein [Parvularculaceae bacterium]